MHQRRFRLFSETGRESDCSFLWQGVHDGNPIEAYASWSSFEVLKFCERNVACFEYKSSEVNLRLIVTLINKKRRSQEYIFFGFVSYTQCCLSDYQMQGYHLLWFRGPCNHRSIQKTRDRKPTLLNQSVFLSKLSNEGGNRRFCIKASIYRTVGVFCGGQRSAQSMGGRRKNTVRPMPDQRRNFCTRAGKCRALRG